MSWFLSCFLKLHDEEERDPPTEVAAVEVHESLETREPLPLKIEHATVQSADTREYRAASLLGIPADIRKLIYLYCFNLTDVKSILTPAHNGTNLRLACRQIYHETAYLSCNHSTLQLNDFTACTVHVWAPAGIDGVPSIKRAVITGRLPGKILPGSTRQDIIAEALPVPMKPDDIIIRYCTCELKNMTCTTYLPLMLDVRDKVIALLDIWPDAKCITFVSCDERDPLPPSQFPQVVQADGTTTPDWRFPAGFRCAFDPNARYWGPWIPEPKKDENGTVVGWRLNAYGQNGGIERSYGLEFLNVQQVYGMKCVLDVGKTDYMRSSTSNAAIAEYNEC